VVVDPSRNASAGVVIDPEYWAQDELHAASAPAPAAPQRVLGDGSTTELRALE